MLFKYKILLGTFLITLLTSSCSKYDDKEDYEKLQGDWKDIHGINILSFSDSTCSYLFNSGGEFTDFSISNDTIICLPFIRDKKRFNRIKFLIVSLRGDSLRLAFKYFGKKSDTLDFVKTRNVLGDEVVIDSIKLSTAAASYPTMKMDISSTGILHYEGIRSVSIKGKYTGRISKRQLNMLEEKFRCIDYKKIIPYAPEEGCFGARTRIEIYVRNKINGYKKSFIISNFLSWEEPAELRIFINYVMNMYKRVNLKAGKI